MPPRTTRIALLALASVLALPPVAHATGTMPLVKRLDTGDTQDLIRADSRSLSGTVDPLVKPWFNGRYQSLVLHDGPDWATSWIPRQWHPNAWVYRKATAYLTSSRVPAALPSLFVKINGTSHLAAVGWGCSSSGCPQPLLDVSNATARNLWLYGAPTTSSGLPGTIRTAGPSSKPSDCSAYGNHQYDGVLYQLACGYKGVWLDDVLVDLRSSPTAAASGAASFVADATTGVPVANSALGTTLSVSQSAWQGGLVTMAQKLRSEIATLRSKGIIASNAGTVAMNLKWNTFGFAEWAATGSNPSISSGSTTGKVIQAADLIEGESGFVDAGLVAGPVSTSWSFNRYRRFVQQVHGLGRRVLQEKVESAQSPLYGGATPWTGADDVSCLRVRATQGAANAEAHFVTAQYNLAATLLDFVPGDRVGDMCDTYGRGWNGYTASLGTPTRGSYQWRGLTRRDFPGGVVLVSPPGGPRMRAYFPTTMRYWPLSGSNALVTANYVDIGPHQGVVAYKLP